MGATNPSGLRARLRALPGPAWILYAGTFVNRFGSFVMVFLVLYLRHRGYSIPQAGSAVALYAVGGLAASILGGFLADRIGRRNATAVSMFGSAAAAISLWRVGSLGAILGLASVFGLFSELYRPASAALLTDLVPTEHRVTAFAVYRWAINAGFAIGPAVAGFLADRSFGWLFLGDAATSAVYGVLALAALPHGLRTRRGQERRGEATRAILSDRAFLRFLAASILIGFPFMQIFSTFPLAVKAAGFSSATYGVLLSLNGVLIILIELPYTGFTGRLPAKPVIAAGAVLIGGAYPILLGSAALPALVAFIAVYTIGEMTTSPIASAYVADLAPERLRGRYQGAWTMTWSISAIAGPVVGTTLYSVNPTLLWWLCGALGLGAAGLTMSIPERRVVPSIGEPSPGRVPGVEAGPPG